MTERDFKGVWIPREIWLDSNLTWTEKMMLVEIDSLARNGECFATNGYFAEFFNLSKDRVSKVVASLRRKGYVDVALQYKEGTRQVERRTITPTGYRRERRHPIGENAYTPVGENAEENNTRVINTGEYSSSSHHDGYREETKEHAGSYSLDRLKGNAFEADGSTQAGSFRSAGDLAGDFLRRMA